MVLRRKVKKGQGDNVYLLHERRSSYSVHNTPAPSTPDLWELRKQVIFHVAKRRNGQIRIQDIAAECNVPFRIAAGWLTRLAREGLLTAVVGQQQAIVYFVKEVGHREG
ncbi:hypothetical protein P5G65_13560 [Paenibacillus chondroitinus]|uniref:Uncharacterized protein n=1 Tax=Paenibacillus chondroitinus TaxID=59842 RepID=A0ABU6DDF8_9BACL|nr:MULTISPECIES: hypothetical protein [Paenibacillus]MCY9663296.1 hypothetical protein [Paenibacillus anseongense]MEB4794931.1 hypothetical protein [Paenibacillus chondroitinus]